MSGILKKIAADIAARKKRFSVLGIGLFGNQIIVYGFNWVLYPFVIWKLGLKIGFPIMIVLSFVLDYGRLLFYDWSKNDWLGIETVKELKEYEGSKKTGRFVSWIMKQSELVIFVFLSIKFDSFVTTAYMRHGSNKFNGMTSRDRRVFVVSLVVGNIYWAILMLTGISVVEHLQYYLNSNVKD